MARWNLFEPAAAPAGGGWLTPASAPQWEAGRLTGRSGRWLVGAVLLLGSFVVGGLSAVNLRMDVAACAAVAIVALVWARPALAAYLVITVTPLTAGIDRGLAIPFVRPSEALALLVGAALAMRGFVRLRTGTFPALRLDRVEVSMILLAVTSSVVPLLWMLVRQREINHDDLLYALVMWKYLGLYAIVRLSVSTEPQVRWCLWLSVAAASIVAVSHWACSVYRGYSPPTTRRSVTRAPSSTPGAAPRCRFRRRPRT
jgi:hypothetical protein